MPLQARHEKTPGSFVIIGIQPDVAFTMVPLGITPLAYLDQKLKSGAQRH